LIERVFRERWRRVLASMVDYVGDFDLVEESTHEAFAIALRLPGTTATIVSVAPGPDRRVERPLRHGCRHQHADPPRAPRGRVAIAADPGRVAVIAAATVL
jgi:RNA polymerase sigma-70 factor (ECF subfamily)